MERSRNCSASCPWRQTDHFTALGLLANLTLTPDLPRLALRRIIHERADHRGGTAFYGEHFCNRLRYRRHF